MTDYTLPTAIDVLWRRYAGWNGATSLGHTIEERATTALGMAQAIVDALATKHDRRYLVRFASTTTASTVYETGIVTLPIAPMLDKSLTPTQQAAIITAFACHETIHPRYTQKHHDAVAEQWRGDPRAADAKRISNIISDIYGEYRLAQRFSGLASIVTPALDYLMRGVPLASLPLPTGVDRMSLITRYPQWLRPDVDQTEVQWWGQLAQRACMASSASEHVLLVREALAHLEQLPPEPSGQPGDGQPDGGQPDDGQPDGGQPDDGKPGDGQPDGGQPDGGQPDDGKPDDGKPGDGKPDDGKPGDGQPDGGQPDDGQPGDGQPDDGQPDDGLPDIHERPDGGDPGLVDRVNAAATLRDAEQTVPRVHASPDPMPRASWLAAQPDAAVAARCRSAVASARSGLQRPIGGYASGRLSDPDLHRALQGDARIMRRRAAPSPPPLTVVMMVDASGSMSSRMMAVASALGGMVAGIGTMPGVDLTVYAWSGRLENDGAPPARPYTHVQPVWQRGQAPALLSGLPGVVGGDTPDGHALRWAVDQVVHRAHGSGRRLIIMATDGETTLPENDLWPVGRSLRYAARHNVDVRVLGWTDQTDPDGSAFLQEYLIRHYGRERVAMMPTAGDIAGKVAAMVARAMA